MPKKLEVDLQVSDQAIDLEKFKSQTNLQPANGEVLMQDAPEEESEPELNADLLN